MARFEGKFTKEGVKNALAQIRERNRELLKLVSRPGVFRSAINAGQLIQARAQEIITEKGHVVIGTLRRSINTQLFLPGDAPVASDQGTSCEKKLSRVRGGGFAGIHDASSVIVEVGSFVEYAPCVEALPDGGFLFQASEEAFEAAAQLIVNGIDPELVRWARGGAD
jgi:hypothetical protein